ncbi:unnamed protein product [Musa textilis]
METEAKESAGGGGEAEDATARAARKRYERLVAVRCKATKGKGAWYWAHLEPILVTPAGSSQPSAAKLRCALCAALFSASNPSRTASEHLKRGACPNFSSPSSAGPAPALPASAAVDPVPISSLPPASPRLRPHHPPTRRRSAPTPLEPKLPLLLSGGKDDLVALARLEDSVKKLKSPMASPAAALSKPQADAALALLADWLLESSSAVSPSALDHPKFQSFLNQVGLPSISPRQLTLSHLQARYLEVLSESEARIRDAAFFQLASDGWKSSARPSEYALVSLVVNLPNGTALFHRSVLTTGGAPSSYAEEVLRDVVAKLCGGLVDRCAGIVADRFKRKALLNLENRNQRMVNLSCQLQAFNSLIKDFARQLPLFGRVSANCLKLTNFMNNQSQVRSIFSKYQLEEQGHTRLLRSPSSSSDEASNFPADFTMVEDVMDFARPIQMAVLDEDYKVVCLEEPSAREMAELIQDGGFWTESEAVYSLVKLLKAMAREIEMERPLIGHCLPLWDELRSKVREWSAKYGIDGGLVDNVIEKRFTKNYHLAWSAAFVLDPLFLIKDTSGKYLPPFKLLTPEQEKDVDRLVTQLVSPEEAHIVLMEMMKWRSEGLDPLYAQAVQVKQHDPSTGKMRIANPQSRRLVWETCLSEFKCLRKVAVRLIFLHATSCGLKRNSALTRWMCGHAQSGVAQKMAFLTAHSRIGRGDFLGEEEKDAELFGAGEDDVLNEFAGASAV